MVLHIVHWQVGLAQTTAALWTLLGRVLAVTRMRFGALELEGDVQDLDTVRKSGEWAMGRIAFDWSLQVIEGEGSEMWREWGLW